MSREGRAAWLSATRQRLQVSAVRREMGLILGLTTVAGVAGAHLLLWIGVPERALRYALSAGPAYATFFALVGWWVRRHAAEAAPGAPPEGEAKKLAIEVPDLSGCTSEIGCLIVPAIVVLATAGLAIHVAPELLAELLGEAALAASMRRSLRALPASGWGSHLLARTWWIVPVAAVGLAALGVAVDRLWPAMPDP